MSDASWSGQLRRISDLERPDHHHLRDDDECYFIGEYTPRAGFAHSDTNQLISNLKKKPSVRNTPQWRHKVRAIEEAGKAIARGLKPDARASITFVPIPPSKLAGDAEHDDRMLQVARKIGGPDVRALIELAEARCAAHEQEEARNPQALAAKLRLNSALFNPRPQLIALVDDMLTTGCSFRACRMVLDQAFEDVPTIGLFVSRRVPSPTLFDFDDL